MKILLDISPLVVDNLTGIGNYVYSLTKETLLQDKQNEYILFCFSPLNKLEKMKNHEFNKLNSVSEIKVIPLPSKLSLSAYLLWQKLEFPNLEEIINIKPSIIHNHEWYTPPKLNSTKLVSTIFDLTFIKNPGWHKEKNTALQTKRLKRLKLANRIISISESTANDLRKYNSAFNEKIDIVYPSVGDHIKVVPLSQSESILQKYNITRPFILSVGTLEPRKNLANLIKAFHMISDKIDDELLIVGGQGWKNEELINLSKITDRVKFLNFVDNVDLNKLYNSCHFFVYPSLYEGFGIPPLEALSVGKKVIVSNTSSLPEVVGDSGIKIDPYSVASISNELLNASKTVNMDEVYVESIDQAKKYSYFESAKKIISIYNSLK